MSATITQPCLFPGVFQTASAGANPTPLTTAELCGLPIRPDLYDAEISFGLNSRVFRVGEYVVKHFLPGRMRNASLASAIDAARGMMRVQGHPNIEHIEFGYADAGAMIMISRFRPNLCRLSDHPKGLKLLDDDTALTQLVSAMAFMDKAGVLHKDLCEWDIEFDRDTGDPFILDFDKLANVNWAADNIHMEQIARGFESNNSTLLLEHLNMDGLHSTFVMEMCVFHYERVHGDREKALSLFRRILKLEHDIYCDEMRRHFTDIGRDDLARAVGIRKERLAYWLDDMHAERLVRLYERKRLHFLMQAANWAYEYTDDKPHAMREFMDSVMPALSEEIARLERTRRDRLDLYPHPILYGTDEPSQPAVEQLSRAGNSTDGETRIVTVDLSDTGTLPKRPDGNVRLAYLGDIHGKLARIARAGTVLDTLRDHGGIDAAFSLGDNVEGGERAGKLFGVMEMLSAMNITASVIGNHDFDYHDGDYTVMGLKGLQAVFAEAGAMYENGLIPEGKLMDVVRAIESQKRAMDEGGSIFAQAIAAADFPFMAANLKFEAGSQFADLFGKLRIIPGAVAEIDGHSILLIGLTDPELEDAFKYHRERGFDHPVSVNGMDVRDLVHARIRAFKDAYPGRKFTTVVLSHCGLHVDKILASEDIDLIIGSHTHNIAHKVIEHGSGRTHIVHGGQNALTMGLLDFKIGDDGRIQDISHTLVDVERSRIEPDEKYGRIVSEHTLPSGRVGRCVHPLTIEGKSTRSTALMNLLTDAVRQKSATDISMNFGGNIREGFSPGDITEEDLNEAAPFGNEVHSISLSGSEIRSMLEYALDVSRKGSKLRSLLLHFSGLKYEVGEDGTLSGVYVGTEGNYRPLDLEAAYTLSYPDFMGVGLGENFPLTRFVREKTVTRHKFTLRDALREEIVKRGQIDDTLEERITIHPSAPLRYNDKALVF